MTTERPTPAELGAQLAETWPPITDEQVEAAARILATVTRLPESPEE